MKIFLTVGSMLPFNRLVKGMDTWAKNHPDAEIFAQIGKNSWCPKNMIYRKIISSSEYRSHFETSDIVVSHVGMGTVITALEYNKPLVMIPRRPELHEVTNNHQLATAKWLANSPGVRIVYSENELAEAISDSHGLEGLAIIETGSRGKLIESLRTFILN
jgi:UDP-N-acetylglucosamine transferase subunit ALG13